MGKHMAKRYLSVSQILPDIVSPKHKHGVNLRRYQIGNVTEQEVTYLPSTVTY
jgi:hypothetical protein